MTKHHCIICESTDYISIRKGTWDIVGVGDIEVSFDICKDCGYIGQISPIPYEQMIGHYEFFSNYQVLDANYKVPEEPNKKAARYIRIASDGCPTPGRIYEVGCASGANLHYFKKAGWDVGGCEPSHFVAKQAKEYHGIDVDVGAEEDILPNVKNVDILMFAHVIEHLHDPVSALKRAKDCLAPDGHILFEVPCSIRPELLPIGWFAFEHLSYFTVGTVQNLLSQAGLAPDEIFTTMIDEYPALTILARPTDRKAPLFNCFENSLQFCEEYNTLDRNAWTAHNQTFLKSTKDVYVWGAGVHTAQLFDETDLLKLRNVIGVIDSDHQKWGKKQGNHNIISPDEFIKKSGDSSVVVSSKFAEESITKAILELGVPRERIITLYDEIWETGLRKDRLA